MYNIIIPKSSIKNVKGVITVMNKINSNSLLKVKDKKDLAKSLNNKLIDNLNKRKDVHGQPFIPLSLKTARGLANMPPLIDTGFLKKNIRYKVEGNIIRLYNETPYLTYHQYGTDKIPVRQIYPEGDLPSPIQALLDEFVITRVTSNLEKILKRW